MLTDRRFSHPARRRALLMLRGAVLLALATGCSSSPSSPAEQEGTDPGGPPSWKLVQQELPSALLSVQVVASGDVYAVGSDVLDGRGPYVLRYDGDRWDRLETEASGDLWWVHEVAADEIWMSGADRLVLRLQPSTATFTEVDVGEGSEILYGIWGPAADDIWAVGGEKCGVVLRFDGAGWRELDLPELEGSQCLPPLFKVWGTAGDRVWIVGERGVTLTWDGSGLALQQTETRRTLFTVHSDAAAGVVAAVGGQQSGEIWELSDGVWNDVTPDGARQMLGVNVGPDGEAVAVGDRASSIRRHADGWRIEENGLSAIGDLSFHAVWVDPGGNAWAVGGQLLVGPFDRGVVARYGPDMPSSQIVNGR